MGYERIRCIIAEERKMLQTYEEDTWERVGLHAENGVMSLYTIFQVYLNHGEAHLQRIEGIKRHLG